MHMLLACALCEHALPARTYAHAFWAVRFCFSLRLGIRYVLPVHVILQSLLRHAVILFSR